MHIFAVSRANVETVVPGQLLFVSANGESYARENFPVDGAIISRALVQLADDRGLLVFADDGQIWPFSFEMAQKVINLFAPRHVHTSRLHELPPRDQAALFEMTLQRALEAEPQITYIFARAKFER